MTSEDAETRKRRPVVVTVEPLILRLKVPPVTVHMRYYHETLVSLAEELLKQKAFGVAVVVAHMACEIVVERAMTKAFAKRSIQDLEDRIMEFVPGYNLGNDRIRKLYTALTGDKVGDEAFWQEFKDSSQRRNRSIHNGEQIAEADANRSVTVVRKFIEHVERVNSLRDS